MKVIAFLAILTSFAFAQADSVFKIQVGEDYQNYSQSDLKRRVYELERAVDQLQRKVFQMEMNNNHTTVILAPSHHEDESCTIEAMNRSFTGTGANKALAIKDAMSQCKSALHDDGFFCKPNCN